MLILARYYVFKFAFVFVIVSNVEGLDVHVRPSAAEKSAYRTFEAIMQDDKPWQEMLPGTSSSEHTASVGDARRKEREQLSKVRGAESSDGVL